MITKIDYTIVGFVGFFTGIFLIPTLFNLGVHTQIFLMAAPLAVAIIFAFGMWLGKFLSQWIPIIGQLAKFAAVGFLNTAIDFGILNLLSAATGITAGVIVGGVNVPGFIVAVVNSYFWNKFWVFRSRETGSALQDFPKFLLVTFVGLLLNSGVIIVLTAHTLFGLQGQALLNAAKVFATVVSLVWNFLGYKIFVFQS